MERHSARDAQRPVKLDFDARIPVPFSVFPSSYRNEDVAAVTTKVKIEGEARGREGIEGSSYSYQADRRYPSRKQDIDINVNVDQDR